MKGEHHKATADVIAMVMVLAVHGGTLSTREVADAAGVHRDTARRILHELHAHEWVRCFESGDGQAWSLGPELPRVGLDFQRRLVEAAAQLRADHDRLLAPLTSAVGG